MHPGAHKRTRRVNGLVLQRPTDVFAHILQDIIGAAELAACAFVVVEAGDFLNTLPLVASVKLI